MNRRLLPALLVLLGLAGAGGAASAQAEVSAFGKIPCVTQPDGTRTCVGTVATRIPSFDGVPIDVNVSLPKPKAGKRDGGYPLMLMLHGYGGKKQAYDEAAAAWLPTAHDLTKRGYVVVSPTDRGFGDSCGSLASRVADPLGCEKGWVKLLDSRFEVHDFQYLAGLLADQGLVSPTRIGAAGPSYGGGSSLMLATLRNRTETTSGKFVPWKSPGKHIPMSLAAAAPSIPWSDLISSLTPNGRGLDYGVAGPTDAFTPAGVMKQSFVSGLYLLGSLSGYYSPPGVDPDADLTSSYTMISAGEPYDTPGIRALLRNYQLHKGSYYVLDGAAGDTPRPPAPMLLSSGFTDDLFPVDETIRYYNLLRQKFPKVPVSLYDMDFGHMRGQNKAADTSALRARVNAWLDYYVKGKGRNPGQPVTVRTETCPKTAKSGGPFTTRTWAAQHPGQLTVRSAKAQTLTSTGGDPTVSKTLDPVAGTGACATVPSTAEAGTASYPGPVAKGRGYTMIGAPTVIANLAITGNFPQVAERLWDVAPNGTQTLVARAVLRPRGSGRTIFQLHPGAWHFARGHRPKLQLLGRDAPYARASNGVFSVKVAGLTLVLPTRETKTNGIHKAKALPLPKGMKRAPVVPAPKRAKTKK